MAIGPQEAPHENAVKKLADLDNVPLFMKSLPSESADDPTVAALQSLAYEGTPDENARNFKEQGNDYFKGKRYREALGFYTQGIDVKPDDTSLLEALLCNRAACNLELSNYGSVLRDCSRALSINPQSAKAYYRSASALLSLDRVEESIDCCDRCLAFDPENKSIQTVRTRALEKMEKKEKREREREERARKEQGSQRLMRFAFEERNLIDIPNPAGSTNPHSPQWDLNDPTRSTLVIPVFFLYPQYATSDVIAKFDEHSTFLDHLSNMFPPNAPPPEWDAKGDYTEGRLVIYAMTHRRRLLKIGKKMTLRVACSAAKAKDGEARDGLEVKDGCLSFVVLPKGDIERKWVEDYKRERDELAR